MSSDTQEPSQNLQKYSVGKNGYNTFSIFGPQGSGKTTQLNLLLQNVNAYSASVGQILRDNLKNSDNPIYIEASRVMTEGGMVNNDVTDGFLKEYLAAYTKAGNAEPVLIFDGFPRSLAQIDSLKSLADAYHSEGAKTAIIKLDMSFEDAKKRCMDRAEQNRLAGKEVRADDTEEAISKRLGIYFDSLEVILAKYRECGIDVYSFGARDTREEIHEEILEALFK